MPPMKWDLENVTPPGLLPGSHTNWPLAFTHFQGLAHCSSCALTFDLHVTASDFTQTHEAKIAPLRPRDPFIFQTAPPMKRLIVDRVGQSRFFSSGRGFYANPQFLARRDTGEDDGESQSPLVPNSIGSLANPIAKGSGHTSLFCRLAKLRHRSVRDTVGVSLQFRY
ncbi:hypothetical protein ACLOJK_003697 [Asimina triloba]